MGDIRSGIGGKYSHRVWQQFWIQKPTSQKSENILGPVGPWAPGPVAHAVGSWAQGPWAQGVLVLKTGEAQPAGEKCAAKTPPLRPASLVNRGHPDLATATLRYNLNHPKKSARFILRCRHPEITRSLI